jgi:conjugative coupling factor TraD (TOL family)
MAIENLLRAPHEFRSTLALLAAGGWIVAQPTLFAMTPAIAAGVTILASAYAAQRAWSGWQLLRYQRGMRRMPKYELSAEDIPWSKTGLFLGRGFEWDARHTQRLYQVREPVNRHFTEQGWLYRMARRYERRLEGTSLESIVPFLQKDSPWNPVRPLPPVGGKTELHGVGLLEDDDVWLDNSELNGHVLVEGTTRVGKSRLLEILATQDIRRGDTVIVFDPKGDEGILRRLWAETVREGREADFVFFHLGYASISARYNPIGNFSRITEIASRIAGNMPSGGDAEAFKNFVWQFCNNIARSSHALGRKLTYESLYQYAENIEPLVLDYYKHYLDTNVSGWQDELENDPEFHIDEKKLDKGLKSRSIELAMLVEYVRRKRIYDPIASGLATVITYENSYFQKLVGSLYPFLGKVTTGEIAKLLSPDYADLDDKRMVFDWETVLAKGKIVYVGLDALEDSAVASAVGASMFSDLTAVAARVYKHGVGHGQFIQSGKRALSIHADEFNELVGDDFIPMINKAGGAGYQVKAYTQTRADVEARVKDSAKALQIEGNFNTRIFLRVLNAHTAELLTEGLPKIQISSVSHMSFASDTNDPQSSSEFGSTSGDRETKERVPMLEPSELLELPKGQAFVQMKGGRLYKVRLPLPSAANDPLMPHSLDAIARDMGERYERKWMAMMDSANDENTSHDQDVVARVTARGRGADF